MAATLLTSAAEHFGRVLRTRTAGDFLMRLARYSPELRLPPHRHPGAYFSYVVRGGFDERGECGEHRFESGTAHFHVAGEAHSGRVGPEAMVLLSIIPGAALAERLERRPPAHGPLAGAASLASRCLAAFREQDDASDLTLEAAGLELVAASWRSRIRERTSARWVGDVRDYLHAHPGRRVTLRELASLAGVHEVHVVRGFRRALGVTPGAYLRRLRIEAARDALLHTPASIAEIALAAGFSSQAHFTRLFRRQTGLTPAAFRRHHRHG
jgi:AraC family transcriptional regulator